MDISSRAEFAADPEAVHTMVTTKEYLDEVCRASEALEFSTEVNGHVTRSSRTLPAPDNAKRFTGATLTVVEEITWGEAAADGSRVGQLVLTVPGQPAGMKGTVTLAPGGKGTLVTLAGDLKVNIPLLGKKLEQAASPAILEGFGVQQRVGDDWLASH
ncbi:DUF2505 domain-containing protein [Propionibacteriaceae bacterium Y1700]|uniref:DUF2505 domain-containing protein n=1 Tax=Microlunatus sp. Y1700 TaxID=3418487 RepID=UPI003DA71BBF